MNTNIFRAYDIRGIHGKDIDADVMENIGKAFGSYIKDDIVVVGRDVRTHSPEMQDSFIKGLLSTGKNVKRAGPSPLGVAALFAWQEKLPYAFITASHLPPEWTGVKFFDSQGIGFLEDMIKDIEKIFLSRKFASGNGLEENIDSRTIIERYKDFLLSKTKAERPLKIVLDCGNGAASLVAGELFSEAGFDVKILFGEPDGSFPNRSPDNMHDPLTELTKSVSQADMGIAYDGDGDRMTVIDNKGERLSPEQLSYVMLSNLLRKRRGPVVANVECTRAIDIVAEKFGCEVKRIKVGHTFMMEAVRKHNAVFGVESSGHYVVPSIIPFDDSLAVSLFLSSLVSSSERSLHDIVKEIPRYPFERINIKTPDDAKFDVIKRIAEKLKAEHENVNTIDGVRTDFENGWVLIRASNTEPMIRVTVEADTQKDLEDLKSRFVSMVRNEIRE